jgi:2-polyprenyl-6-hydroxyphenyl methylase/3-demethylubiquinone-9 3-methyltransferase
MNKVRVGSFYDVVWTEYVPELEASEKHWRLFYSPEEVSGRSVLDAGCGTGIFSIIFARNGAGRVTGIDISPGSLETAKSLKARFAVDNAEFRLQDMLRLPFADACFDIVWAWGTVHHTTDPFRAISELIRVLRPGGSLFLAVYKRTKVTFIHEVIRKTLIKTPRRTWKRRFVS